MTRKRRAASVALKMPLTKKEVTGISKPEKYPYRQIVCVKCCSLGFGGLTKLGEGIYICNNTEKCKERANA